MGNGPLWPEYTHCWVDNELAEVAELHGVHVLEIRTTTHRHEHSLRRGSRPPPHAAKAYAAYQG